MTRTIGTMGILMLVLLMIGCGAANLREGRGYLADGEYAKALEAFTDALNDDPDNPKIHRDLGIAYYKAGQYEQAAGELETAGQELEKDSKVVFYLGMTYEELEQYDKAIVEYSKYPQFRRLSQMRQKMQQRIQWLIGKQATQWAKERMKMEEVIDPASIPDNTIAVTYFKPFVASEELEPLHKGLTQLLIVDLSIVRSLKVLERIRLREVYNELGFGSTDVVDERTSPRMGKLLGANSIVTGTFTGFGDNQWRIDPAIGRVKIGSFQALDSVKGPVPLFLQVEKELVMDILDNLAVETTQEERDEILSNVPTESLQAFLAYSRGLDHLDNGLYTQAAAEFEAALALDPMFNLAEDDLMGAKLLAQPVGSTGELEDAWNSILSAEEAQRGLLAATMENTAQGDVGRVPGSEPILPEKESDIPLEVEIRW